MITYDLPDSFEQLVAFGQRPDVKIRPVLLRVLVDMFVSKAHHSASDLSQFEELMIHLLDDADDETRLAVAEKLSVNPHTPPTLLDRFIAERGAIASKVLAHAPMESRVLNAAVVFGTTAMAEAVASRGDLDATVVRSLAERPEATVLLALAANRAAPIERSIYRYLARRSSAVPALATMLAERGDAAGEAQTLFFSADRRRRAELIAAARRQDLGQTLRPLSSSPSEEALAAIRRAALVPGVEGLDTALANALGLSHADIARLIDDRHGEPLALALAALDVGPEIAARVFILGDPTIGRSYERVKSLVAIVESVAPASAHRLVMSMLGRPAEAPRRSLPARSDAPEGAGRRIEAAATRATPVKAAAVRLTGRAV